MTTPLDRDLAERLERLAAAVPVRPGQLDPVHATAVRARQQLRLRWLTPLIVLLVAAIALAVMSSSGHRPPRGITSSDGPSASGDTTDESGRPFGFDRDGDFVFTLGADKAVYAPNEPIHIEASLTYVGALPTVDVTTDSGGPTRFRLFEKVYGGINLGGVSLLMCKTTTLTRDAPLVESFKKSGGFDGDHPDAEKFRAFFADKELRLPEGTWHFTASASGPCLGGGPAFDVGSQITIVVSDDPTATPGLPGATDWQDKPVYGGDDNGWMSLQVKSTHPTYAEGTPIDLDAWFWFADGPPEVQRPFVQQVEYRITQSDPGAVEVRTAEIPLDCATTTMTSGEERHLNVDDREVVLVKAVDWPDSAVQALQRGELLLPPGHWRITVTVRANFGPCATPTDTWATHASVEVDVVERQ